MVSQIQAKPGEVILVTGANGGVVSLNIQIAANVFGAKVIAVVGDLKDGEKLKELGAAEVVSYRSETLIDDILKAAGGPVDSVLDVVGDALLILK